MEAQKKLGQLLVERGAITGEQLIRAIQSQRALGGRIGTCLLEMDVLSEDHLLDALSHQLAVPAARIDELRQIKEDVLDLVPARVAVRCQAIPFIASKNEVHVATLNVHHLAVLDELAFCSNRRVVPHIANEVRIAEALEKYYGHECTPRFGHLLDRLNRSRYMWDESAKILLGSAAPMEWHGIEVLEAQWNDQRRLMRPAASRSQRTASAQTSSVQAPPVQTTPAQVTPAQVTPAQTTPAQVTPAQVTPAQVTPAQTTPTQATASGIESQSEQRSIPPRQNGRLERGRLERGRLERGRLERGRLERGRLERGRLERGRLERGRLDLADLDRLLAAEPDRQRIGEIVLRFLGQYFSRSALFRISQETIRGWMARGDGIDSWMFQALELPLEEPSLFLNLAQGSDLYVGSMPPLPNHVRLAQVWGGELPRDCLLVPLKIRNRLVSVLYGDCGARGLGEVDIEALRQLAAKAAKALELCILKKKLNQL